MDNASPCRIGQIKSQRLLWAIEKNGKVYWFLKLKQKEIRVEELSWRQEK